jgi:adenosine deaminase
VAFEAAEDALADGCVLAEFRIAPLLFEEYGLSGDVVVNALLKGLAASSLPTGLIVCAMRNHGEAEVDASADLALRWLGRGVMGFDLAGAEAGWPATRYAAALQRVQAAGLPLTLHAGEADVGERVLEAVDLGARRIGHGIHLVDLLRRGDSAAVTRLRELGVHLEVCPTSNVHTGAVKLLSEHPINTLWRAGISVSFNTDNRLMSCLSASSEALDLTTHCGLGWADLVAMGLAAAEASFFSPSAKHAAKQRLLGWAAAQGLTLPQPL